MPESILVAECYPSVDKAFSVSGTVAKYEKIVGAFIDNNNEILSAIGPTKNMLFTDYEKNNLYTLLNITPEVINKSKAKAKDIKATGQNLRDPFKSLLALVVRYFSVKKQDRIVHITCTYLGCAMYPSLFHKYFKFTPNENIMSYTINELSNKYKLKQYGNMLATIDDICYGAYKLHKEDIDKGFDRGIVQFILAVQTRLNSFMKKLATEFYKNYKDGNYLNTEFESNDADNFHEADSTIYAVSRIVDNVSLKLIVNGPPIKLITIAAKNNGVSVNELRNYTMVMITDDRMADIKKIIEAIMYLFLYDKTNSPDMVNSNKFLIYCLDMYKRSNTTDEHIITIKSILDKWLDDLGVYKKTQRLATINSFRRAIFTFFVLSIQYYNVR